MIRIPHNYVAVLAQNVIVHIATLNRDGSPQVTPIWAESDGDFVRFSSSEGRVKVDNLRRDSRVALSFTDPDDWTTAFAMRGRVIAIEHRGWDLIDPPRPPLPGHRRRVPSLRGDGKSRPGHRNRLGAQQQIAGERRGERRRAAVSFRPSYFRRLSCSVRSAHAYSRWVHHGGDDHRFRVGERGRNGGRSSANRPEASRSPRASGRSRGGLHLRGPDVQLPGDSRHERPPPGRSACRGPRGPMDGDRGIRRCARHSGTLLCRRGPHCPRSQCLQHGPRRSRRRLPDLQGRSQGDR